ncbi:MAG: hypothetical protein NC253_11075 [Ruminococcus sp.]|nr:hypothetical protein [Ruminococcus sp.]MCM1380311.1 hypothetical protein [Muribaculaceae bacterium]MCM1478291.1 hypothetical protein [Muribaculaceae bacterium]
MEGWIKLHRKFLDWQWYSDPAVKGVFIHLLLIANTEDKKWQGIDIKRGQAVTSIGKISQATGHSIQEVRTAIKKLKATECLTSKAYPKFSVFTVINFDNYQDVTRSATSKQQASNKQLTSKQQASNNTVRIIRTTEEQEEQETDCFSSCVCSVVGAREDFSETPATTQKRKEKNILYGRYVRLTEKQHAELVADFGKDILAEYIERVDNYVESLIASGKRSYSNHYLTLSKWLNKDVGKAAKGCGSDGHSYDLDKFVEHAMYNTPKVKKSEE